MIKEKEQRYKLLSKMAFPILMNYVVTTLFEVLDKAIVGNYSTEGFAAVGVAGSVIYAITGSLGMLSVAYNIIAAKAIGLGDDKGFKENFLSAMSLSIVIGIGIIALSLIGGEFLFKEMFGLEGNVLKDCLGYFYISSVTILLNMIIFIFSAYFRNLKNTKISLYSTIVATGVNIVFDYSLVYGKFGFPEVGVKGAAIGSVIGLTVGIVIYIIEICKEGKVSFKVSFKKNIFKNLIILYIPLLGQDLMEGTVFTLILTGIVSRLGVYKIAAYSLSESIGSIIALPIFAFSSSAMTLSVQKSYEGDDIEACNILKTAIKMSLLIVLTLGIITLIFAKFIFSIISNDKVVVSRVSKIFIVVIIVQLINVFQQIYKSFLQGKTDETYVLKCTIFISLISIVWILFLSKLLSLVGVYIGIGISYLLLVIFYYKKMIKYSKIT